MEFFDVVDTQRALRRFRTDPLPDDVVRRVLAAAVRAPSARGAEPWCFVVVRDPTRRAAVGTAYRSAWDRAETAIDLNDADRDIAHAQHYARMMRAVADLAASMGDAPILVVCCLDHSRLGPLADGRGTLLSPAAAYASIFPAVQNLLLAARALEVGAVLTTLHRAFEPELRRLLALPDTVEPVAIVPLGYSRDRYGPTRRRPLDEVVSLDRFGERWPAG